MRVLTSSILIAEAIVLGLLIPVTQVVGGYPPVVGWLIGALALTCLVLPGRYGRAYYLPLGTAIQVAAIALGVLEPMMAVLGGIFAALWWTAIRLGRKVEAPTAG